MPAEMSWGDMTRTAQPMLGSRKRAWRSSSRRAGVSVFESGISAWRHTCESQVTEAFLRIEGAERDTIDQRA